MYNITAKRPDTKGKAIRLEGIKNDTRATDLIWAMVHEGYEVTIAAAEDAEDAVLRQLFEDARESVMHQVGVSPMMRGEELKIAHTPQDHPERCAVD